MPRWGSGVCACTIHAVDACTCWRMRKRASGACACCVDAGFCMQEDARLGTLVVQPDTRQIPLS